MDFDPNAIINQGKLVLIGVAGLVALYLGVVILIKSRSGDSGKTWRILGAALPATLLFAVALGLGIIAFGSAFWGWAVPGLSPTP